MDEWGSLQTGERENTQKWMNMDNEHVWHEEVRSVCALYDTEVLNCTENTWKRWRTQLHKGLLNQCCIFIGVQ